MRYKVEKKGNKYLCRLLNGGFVMFEFERDSLSEIMSHVGICYEIMYKHFSPEMSIGIEGYSELWKEHMEKIVKGRK